MARRAALILALAGALLPAADLIGNPRPADGDPFSFFEPVVTVTPSERQRIDSGEVLAHVLPARDGEIAVFAVSKLEAEPEALVRWTHRIEALKRSPYVIAIRRFSNPPVLSDLDSLVLDDVDLEGIRECQAGDCSVKLAAQEIESLKKVSAAGGDWKPAMQREFRRLLLKRVTDYQAKGLGGLPPIVDRVTPTHPGEEFAAILSRSPHLRTYLPELTDGLSNHPQADLPSTGSFLYWSKESYGRGKPVISVTQVHIVRPTGPSLPEVVVIGQEVFASHYRDGSLGTTFVLDGGETRYLAYLNRSRLDRLDGMWGGLKRTVVERKLRSEVKNAITGIRQRIESGDPS
ncbi:MAG TPA: hypothetical protein VFS23_09375 [Vicinamibacterales bacterium]|nr:hypothetical protein [Vicinamibacterales bacterium]